MNRICVILLSMVFISTGCQKKESQEEANKKTLREIFNIILSQGKTDNNTINKYFHEDYVQLVDGEKLNRDDFVRHIKALHNSEKNITVEFKHMLAEANKVATVHTATGTKEDGQQVVAKVIALFIFKDGRIIMCDELTSIIEGTEEDKANASKTE